MSNAAESGRRVLVGMPRYGQVELGAAAGYLRPFGAGTRYRRAVPVDVGSSATPHAMNCLLAMALDMRDAGEIDDLAMIHADICPSAPGWLDVLDQERQRVGAVAISAIAPLKGEGGLTSTALGDPSDPWAPVRHVTLADYNPATPTLTSKDCGPGAILLINTGLLLLDLHWPHWDDFAFAWATRIRRGDGRRVAQLWPEDWDMSRYVHTRGGVVAATWLVELAHIGSYRWINRPVNPTA